MRHEHDQRLRVHDPSRGLCHTDDLVHDVCKNWSDLFLHLKHLVANLKYLLAILAKSGRVQVFEQAPNVDLRLHVEVLFEVWRSQVFEADSDQVKQGQRKDRLGPLDCPIHVNFLVKMHAAKRCTSHSLRSDADHFAEPIDCFFDQDDDWQVPLSDVDMLGLVAFLFSFL